MIGGEPRGGKRRREGTPGPWTGPLLVQRHLQFIPGVRMEAVSTAASQGQMRTTKGLLRASPANEAPAVVIPGGGCLSVTEPLGVSRIVGWGGKQRPGREGLEVPRPEVCFVLVAVK